MPPTVCKALPYSSIHFPVCESTHRWALDNLRVLVSNHGLSSTRPVRVSTDSQTRGVGQPIKNQTLAGEFKTWANSSGNVFVTFVFPWLQRKMDSVVNLPQVASVAIVQTLQKIGVDSKVKWVNDVMVNGKKIAGVLCNATGYRLPSTDSNEEFTAVLVSVGLNVKSTPTLEASEFQPITSIADELQQSDVEASAVLDLLSIELYRTMGIFESRGFDSIHSALEQILIGQGTLVSIQQPAISPTSSSCDKLPNDEIFGKFIGLCPKSGSLLLKTVNSDTPVEVIGGRIRRGTIRRVIRKQNLARSSAIARILSADKLVSFDEFNESDREAEEGSNFGGPHESWLSSFTHTRAQIRQIVG
ncbi:bifunctional ligase/repressor BirA-like [Condylostylus longicornis]|uniref:bifunctional ligase/repressor BirA-like n=1 Tax=Condylostylus longicornis TaxID=2530218 RepID=UPI00244DD840|nr:bifunctional ligase/repressor BirA-like [Condylostylus longicornis]